MELNTASENTAQALRLIPETEKFQRKDDVINSDTIRVTYAVRQDSNSPRYEKVTTFDFSGVSPEERMVLACTNGVVVWAQRMLRDLGDSMLNPELFSKVDVAEEVLRGTRAPIDPVARALRLVSRLSPEQREAFLLQSGISATDDAL